jgi:hypothetical protein
LPLVFGQAFFKKGCATTVGPVDHAVMPFSIKPFFKRFSVKPFFEKVCDLGINPSNPAAVL